MKSLQKAVIASLLIGLFSCSTEVDPTKGKMIFRYNQSSGISSLDPAFARVQGNIWAVNQLFNTLVALNDSLLIVPSIAKYWSIEDSGMIYRFTLRSDIAFHPHECFDSEVRFCNAFDAAFSLNRLRDPKLASPGSWLMNPVDKVIAINDSILEIHLIRPFPPFLSTLSMAYASIVPIEVDDCLSDIFGKEPIGTGPFLFTRWLWNEKLVFRKNPSYFEIDEQGKRLPYLDAVAIRLLPDKQAEYLELLQGNIDMISGLDPSYVHDILSINGGLNEKHKAQVEMLKGPYLNTEYLGIFQEELPSGSHCLQDNNLRRAFSLSIDREDMLIYLRRGVGEAAFGGILPSGMPGKSIPHSPDFNRIDSARSLLVNWKKEHTSETPSVKIHTTAAYLDLCEFVQAGLNRVGFEAEIELMPPSLLREGMATGKLQVFRASWIADYPDAQNYLSLYYSPNHAPNGPNYSHFSDSLFDMVYEQSLLETNEKERYAQYQFLDSMTVSSYALIPLYYDQAIRFHGKGWHGLEPNPLNLLDLRSVYYLRDTSTTTGK